MADSDNVTKARLMLQELGSYSTPGPRGQMDVSVRDRIIGLAFKSDLCPKDLKELLDDCTYGSLCSDFVMIALDGVWQMLLKTPEPRVTTVIKNYDYLIDLRPRESESFGIICREIMDRAQDRDYANIDHMLTTLVDKAPKESWWLLVSAIRYSSMFKDILIFWYAARDHVATIIEQEGDCDPKKILRGLF